MLELCLGQDNYWSTPMLRMA